MNKKILELSDKNREEVFSSNKKALVVFSASWCGPCKMLAPLLEEISKNENLETVIAKVDVDASPNISLSMKIRAVPSIFYFKDGKPVEKFSEYPSRKSIIEFIKNNE
jgi:thioredoxin 1